MSDNYAPRCRFAGCCKPTWNPSGLCHLHINSSMDDNGTTAGDQRFTQPPPSTSDASQMEDELRMTFPDIREPITPQSVREQVIATVQSAVNIDVYRGFPRTDVEDPAERRRLLSRYHDEITGRIMPEGNSHSIDGKTARNISHSSVDEYGRDLMDSGSLAAYGVARERDLALSRGVAYDEAGIAYDQPLERYYRQQRERFHLVANDEFQRQLLRYNSIIEDISGRPPRCPEPVVREFNPDAGRAEQPNTSAPVGNQYAGVVQTELERERLAQERREKIKDTASAAARGLGNIIKGAYENHRESRQDAAQSRRSERAEQKNLHYRDKDPKYLTPRERYLLRQEKKDERRDRELRDMQYKYYKRNTRGFF